MKKYTTAPDPDIPLTDEEWKNMGEPIIGLKGLPDASAKSFVNAFKEKEEHSKKQAELIEKLDVG